jgi:hypothetical protein
MLLRLIAATALTLSFLFTGCATPKGMAVLDDAAAVAKSNKSVYLMTVTLKNTFVPAYQPKLQSVKVMKKNGESHKIFLFEADLLSRNETNSATTGSSYLLRMEIEPGDYTILGLNSYGQSMLITGEFFTPLDMRLKVTSAGVFYLGHIDATVRERKGEEFRAGSYLPSQEQKLTGASSGTFDVVIADQWDTDSANFLYKFPALKGINIQKAILPAFNRESIQRWWERSAFVELP